MTLVPIICYRCSECERIYEEKPTRCVCERTVFIKGERFGPFVIINAVGEQEVKVRCILCDTVSTKHYSNIRKQTSCGCKPKYIEPIELTEEIFVYRCKRCGKIVTKRLPIVSYCCEDKGEEE